MINQLSNPNNRNRSATKISKVMSSNKHCFKQGGQGCFDIDECSIAEGVSRHFDYNCQKNSFSSPLQKNSHCKHDHSFSVFTPFDYLPCQYHRNDNCRSTTADRTQTVTTGQVTCLTIGCSILNRRKLFLTEKI